MNDDPMLGSREQQAAYRQQILDAIQEDVEQRKQQRLAEFLRTRESPAVIQGATGTADSLIQAIR